MIDNINKIFEMFKKDIEKANETHYSFAKLEQLAIKYSHEIEKYLHEYALSNLKEPTYENTIHIKDDLKAHYKGLETKTLNTGRTKITIKRRRYEKETEGSYYPLDIKYGIDGLKYWSPVMASLMAYGSHKQSFRETSKDFNVYLNIKVSETAVQNQSEKIGEEIQKDYLSYLPSDVQKPCALMVIMLDGGRLHVGKEDYKEVKSALVQKYYDDGTMDEYRFAETSCAKDFLPCFDKFMQFIGVLHAQRKVILGDCGQFIDTYHQDYCPDATRIADIFHAMEYLNNAIKSIYNDNVVRKYPEYKEWTGLLEIGGMESLINFLSTASKKYKTKAIEDAIRYFKNHKEKMRYDDFEEKALPISSGPMEGSIRYTVHDRMGKSRSTWTVEDANKILYLRCWVLNGFYKTYMQKRYHLECNY